jgi:hypothetical protein
VVPCQCQELTEEGLSALATVRLPNIAAIAHLDLHAEWILDRRRRGIASVQDLWERRAELLPHLEFCPCVQDPLLVSPANHPRFRQIVNKLFVLEAYFAGWREGGFDPNAFPKCNPASPETLARYPNDYRFVKADGLEATASWHLYLTPGKGRLYFEADGENRRCSVCHVGDKLPDVTYGRT